MMMMHPPESIGDIEDLASEVVKNRSDDESRYSKVTSVKPRLRNVERVRADSVIPGTQSIYVKTWGCTHNTSDSEYMAGQLASYGYRIIDDKLAADLWLLNGCTVKNPAEDHFRNEVEMARKLGKYVVVAGCVSQAAPATPYLKGLSIVGVQQIDRVIEVVEAALQGNCVRLLGKKKQDGRKTGGASLSLPKIRKNELIEIIPINTGCLNQCTYCKTKHARGQLGSYPPDEIVCRALQAVEEGVCEIWLTSEDTGAYGKDISTSLPELLWKVVEVLPSGCMLRIGMTNPPYILEHLEEISKILNHPRVYSFLHIPVQSGSDAVLADMKREYCKADFERVVEFLKNSVPGVTIATDVICGFPTETDEDFEETLQLVEKYQFPSLFINQFYPRPGTPAACMRRVPPKEVKKRTRKISELFASYSPYSERNGERYFVLITELAHDGDHLVGHNKFYEQILIAKDDNMLGKVVEVEVTSTGKHYMVGKVINDGAILPPYSRSNRKEIENRVIENDSHMLHLDAALLHSGIENIIPVAFVLLIFGWISQKVIWLWFLYK